MIDTAPLMYKFKLFNPNGAGLLNVARMRGGGTMCLHLLDQPKTLTVTINIMN